MPPPTHPLPARRRFTHRPGFTLVEVLVVVGVVAVLLAVAFPVAGRAREQARRAACAHNLRQVGTAMFSYAASNRRVLPQHAGNSYWLFDLPLRTRDALVRHGLTRDALYCPSNAVTQNHDNLWYYPNPAKPIHCATGYQFLSARPTAPMPPMLYLRPFVRTLRDDLKLHVTLTRRELRRPPDVELVTDMVNSAGQAGSAAESFHSAKGGHPEVHPTSHLRGGRPAGGNILFLDGHLAWRDWRAMRLQTTHQGPKGRNNFYF